LASAVALAKSKDKIEILMVAKDCEHESLTCLQKFLYHEVRHLKSVDSIVMNVLIHHVIKLGYNVTESVSKYAKQLGFIFNHCAMSRIPCVWATGPR
jgi:hypothetical protein